MSCVVRCLSCNREIQSKYTVYLQLLKEGKTMREALDGCGLPTGTAFQSSGEITPPPTCCRAIFMATCDLTEQHTMYQSAIRWGEGLEAVGSVTKKELELSKQEESKDMKDVKSK